MKKHLLTYLTLFFILSLSVAGFAKDIELKDPYISEMPQGKWGGTLISTKISDPNTFNPFISADQASEEIFENRVFECLAMTNPLTGEYEPTLAKSWEVSEDGCTWTFHLRRGVQWHDGVEFTADDVIFTYDATMDKEVNSPGRYALFVDGEPIKYKKIDKYTVQFITPKPYAPFLSTMLYIVPKHKLYDAWKKGELRDAWGIDMDVKDYVGTGPLVLKQYVPGQRVVYERNPNYWRLAPDGKKSLPYIERWVQEIVPDVDTALLKFQNGETHFAAVPPQDYERVKEGAEGGNYTVEKAGYSYSSTLIAINMNPRNPDYKEHPWKNKWFRNIHFRRALNHAIDRETIGEQVYAGYAIPQWSPVSANNKFYYNKNVRKYPFNLEKAREELKKGGFTWDEEGQLIGPEGHPVEFSIVTTETSNNWVDTMNIISSDFQKLGAKVHANPVSFSNLIQRLTSSYKFDMLIVGWGGGGTELHGGHTMWLSSAQYHMWNPNQKEPEFEWEARIDEIWDLAATTLDKKERKKYYDEWQMIYSEQLPIFYSVNSITFMAYKNELKNVYPNTLGGDLYNSSIGWNIANLYLE